MPRKWRVYLIYWARVWLPEARGCASLYDSLVNWLSLYWELRVIEAKQICIHFAWTLSKLMFKIKHLLKFDIHQVVLLLCGLYVVVRSIYFVVRSLCFVGRFLYFVVRSLCCWIVRSWWCCEILVLLLWDLCFVVRFGLLLWEPVVILWDPCVIVVGYLCCWCEISGLALLWDLIKCHVRMILS